VLLSDELEFGLEEAYRVQDEVTAARLAGGERLTGWKLGYTSAAMRAQMGITSPNFGPLTDAMLLTSPAQLPGGALQPRVASAPPSAPGAGQWKSTGKMGKVRLT
jgi:2-keto-4-pentenoate hydratase